MSTTNPTEQILKMEDGLQLIGGLWRAPKGSLVLNKEIIYFVSKKKREFEIPIRDILSVNQQKGIGNGVDDLVIFFTESGSQKKVKVRHFSFMTGMTVGTLSRLSSYFGSWEQMINDVRFGKIS